jgi:hypothetical protein
VINKNKMPIPSSSWDSRHETSYPQEFRTRYRTLGDAIYDAYDNFDPSGQISGFDSKATFEGIVTAAEGYIAWLTNNLTGGSAPLGGGSFEDPYAFDFGPTDKESLLKALGCRADRNPMCSSYIGKSKTTAVEHTIFGLALCDPGVRAQLGDNYEPFEWTPGGNLKLYDRYNFTDLQDFSRAPGGNIIEAGAKTLLANVLGQGSGGLVGILNESGIPDAVNSWFNGTSQDPDYDASPYFEWRGDGASFTITSITRTDRTVTLTTSSPHGLNNTDGGGIKIVDDNPSDSTGFNIRDDNQGGYPNGVDVTVVDETTLRYYDPYDREDASSDGSGLRAVQKKRWGKSRHMYTVDTFSATDLRTYNPELYYDAVARGLIPYESIPGSIEVGDKQPNPFVSGIAGLSPQAPVSTLIDPENSNTYGFSYGQYPAPYNSWSQGIVNATYDLGPYAKINKFVFRLQDGVISTCNDSEDWQGKSKGENPLWGRLVILPSGPYAGEIGFVLQNWYNFDDSPYNTNDGTAQGTPFPSKASWWRSTTKSKTLVHFSHLSTQPLIEVEVAYSSPNFGDVSYYKGTDLGAQPDYTVELISVLVAAAAISGIIF